LADRLERKKDVEAGINSIFQAYMAQVHGSTNNSPLPVAASSILVQSLYTRTAILSFGVSNKI
jgi:hypothetical protein